MSKQLAVVEGSPYCVRCDTFMEVEKNGVEVKISQPHSNFDWYLSGDKYRCPICHFSVIVSFGDKYAKEKV